jgi:hypothetical protein
MAPLRTNGLNLTWSFRPKRFVAMKARVDYWRRCVRAIHGHPRYTKEMDVWVDSARSPPSLFRRWNRVVLSGATCSTSCQLVLRSQAGVCDGLRDHL